MKSFATTTTCARIARAIDNRRATLTRVATRCPPAHSSINRTTAFDSTSSTNVVTSRCATSASYDTSTSAGAYATSQSASTSSTNTSASSPKTGSSSVKSCSIRKRTTTRSIEPTQVKIHGFECPRCLDSLHECPRQDSNLRTRFRKPLLYPLSYGSLNADCHWE